LYWITVNAGKVAELMFVTAASHDSGSINGFRRLSETRLKGYPKTSSNNSRLAESLGLFWEYDSKYSAVFSSERQVFRNMAAETDVGNDHRAATAGSWRVKGVGVTI